MKSKLLVSAVFGVICGAILGVFLRQTFMQTDGKSNAVSGSAVSASAVSASAVSGSAISGSAVSGNAVSGSAVVPRERVVKYNSKKVKSALSKKSFIKVRQLLQTKIFNSDNVEVSNVESENFSIKYDTKHRISKLNMKLDFGTGLGNGEVQVINDFKNNNHYTKEDGKGWVRNKENTVVLNLNHDKIESAYDVYTQLLKDFIPKKGKTGVLSDGLEVYKTSGKVTKEDVNGCQYDKLLSKEITTTFKKKLPLSVQKTVKFIFGGKTYQVTTTIDVEELSNRKLKITEIKNKK